MPRGRPAPLRVLALIGALCGALMTPACAGRSADEPRPSEIGVNSFLWRDSLDTIEFMPLASADPFGGVILTEWYANPEAPGEQFKITIYILDTRLRADAIKVNLAKQVFDSALGWRSVEPDPGTALQLENAILTRARQLKIATLEG